MKESPAAVKGPRCPPPPPPQKRPVVAAEVIHLLIALMCHIFFFSFFFEVILQPERERGEVSQILACGQTIFPLGGVGPIHSDLNSPTLEYLVNE